MTICSGRTRRSDSPEPLGDRDDLDAQLLLPWLLQHSVLDQQLRQELPPLCVVVSLDLPALEHLAHDVLGSLEVDGGDDKSKKSLKQRILVLNILRQVRVEHNKTMILTKLLGYHGQSWSFKWALYSNLHPKRSYVN